MTKAERKIYSKVYREKMLKEKPLYHTWANMKTRCYNTKRANYKHYGGRNIKVCDEWLNSYDQFEKDMGTKPKGMTLDRIDNNGNYEPSNCKWSTVSEQNYNKRNVS